MKLNNYLQKRKTKIKEVNNEEEENEEEEEDDDEEINTKKNINNKKSKKKENKINNLLEEKKIFFDEKQKLDAQNLDLQKQEKNLAKTIEKKNLYIKSYEKENENLMLAIEDYESRRDKLLERADQPRKNKQRMKDIENEIKVLGENIIKYKVEGEEKENSMEDNVNKNK